MRTSNFDSPITWKYLFTICLRNRFLYCSKKMGTIAVFVFPRKLVIKKNIDDIGCNTKSICFTLSRTEVIFTKMKSFCQLRSFAYWQHIYTACRIGWCNPFSCNSHAPLCKNKIKWYCLLSLLSVRFVGTIPFLIIPIHWMPVLWCFYIFVIDRVHMKTIRDNWYSLNIDIVLKKPTNQNAT